jgi:hypothetical protein
MHFVLLVPRPPLKDPIVQLLSSPLHAKIVNSDLALHMYTGTEHRIRLQRH